MDVALREFPDDPDLPDIYMRLLHIARLYKELDAYAAEALKRFADEPLCRLTILNDMLISLSHRKERTPPELLQLFHEACDDYYRLPPLVEKYMPRPTKA